MNEVYRKSQGRRHRWMLSPVLCGWCWTWCLACAASVNTPAGWLPGNPAGWTCQDLVTEAPAAALSATSNDVVKLAFKRQTMKMPPEHYLVMADEGSSSGAFVGNYRRAGVTGIRFHLLAEKPMRVSVQFGNEASGRLWECPLGTVQAGEWLEMKVPVDPEILYNVNGVEDVWAAFREDLENVTWVGVAVERNSAMDAHGVWLKGFNLTGPGPAFASWMEQFRTAAEAPPGRHLLAHGDLDGDGMSNQDEWVAGTSAEDAGDVLAIRAETSGASAPVLRWRAVEGRSYTVWRSASPASGFAPVRADIAATPPENTYVDGQTPPVEGPFFYRLSVQAPE